MVEREIKIIKANYIGNSILEPGQKIGLEHLTPSIRDQILDYALKTGYVPDEKGRFLVLQPSTGTRYGQQDVVFSDSKAGQSILRDMLKNSGIQMPEYPESRRLFEVSNVAQTKDILSEIDPSESNMEIDTSVLRNAGERYTPVTEKEKFQSTIQNVDSLATYVQKDIPKNVNDMSFVRRSDLMEVQVLLDAMLATDDDKLQASIIRGDIPIPSYVPVYGGAYVMSDDDYDDPSSKQLKAREMFDKLKARQSLAQSDLVTNQAQLQSKALSKKGQRLLQQEAEERKSLFSESGDEVRASSKSKGARINPNIKYGNRLAAATQALVEGRDSEGFAIPWSSSKKRDKKAKSKASKSSSSSDPESMQPGALVPVKKTSTKKPSSKTKGRTMTRS